jgi:chloramphenicol 3-O phosphotransferase
MNPSDIGKIIIINGPSSSGKTTLSLALQKKLSIPFIRFSFDLFIENKILPRDQINRGSFSWQAMRPAVFDGLHRCIPALASAGNNVIFDHIIETEGWLHDLVRYLADFDVFFVGLHCSIEELERREMQRGDRRIGEARLDSQFVHRFGNYDLELNAEKSAEENARILTGEWEKRTRPSAFNKMMVQNNS